MPTWSTEVNSTPSRKYSTVDLFGPRLYRIDTVCLEPGLTDAVLMSWVYALSRPTFPLPVTSVGKRSIRAITWLLETNQSKSWPVAKSTMFNTTPAC